MTILGPAGPSVHPFTDSVDLTFPVDRADDVEAVLRPHLVAAGGSVEAPGLWRLPRLVETGVGVVQAPKSKRRPPTVRLKRSYGVLCVGISGGSCDSLRLRGMWVQLLSELAQYEHRVTRLHATIDLPLDGPTSIRLVTDAARAGGLRLSRKALNPRHVKGYTELDARGDMAGGVYLGSSSADARALCYCKRCELENNGLPDPGPRTRVELRLSVDGITLRDVADPAAIFWHYASAIVGAPAGAASWSAGDTGFMLDRVQERDVWSILKRRVDEWADLRELGLLADQMGQYGRSMLVQLIATALGVSPQSLRRWAAGVAA